MSLNHDSVNSNGKKPISELHKAAILGDNLIVQQLIESGEDVDCTNEENWTALMFASKYGHFQTVDYLLKMKANVNLKNHQGRTPLMLASISTNFKIIKLLIDNGALVEERDANQFTALMLVKDSNKEAILQSMQVLIDHGAKAVNVGDTSCIDDCLWATSPEDRPRPSLGPFRGIVLTPIRNPPNLEEEKVAKLQQQYEVAMMEIRQELEEAVKKVNQLEEEKDKAVAAAGKGMIRYEIIIAELELQLKLLSEVATNNNNIVTPVTPAPPAPPARTYKTHVSCCTSQAAKVKVLPSKPIAAGIQTTKLTNRVVPKMPVISENSASKKMPAAGTK